VLKRRFLISSATSSFLHPSFILPSSLLHPSSQTLRQLIQSSVSAQSSIPLLLFHLHLLLPSLNCHLPPSLTRFRLQLNTEFLLTRLFSLTTSRTPIRAPVSTSSSQLSSPIITPPLVHLLYSTLSSPLLGLLRRLRLKTVRYCLLTTHCAHFDDLTLFTTSFSQTLPSLSALSITTLLLHHLSSSLPSSTLPSSINTFLLHHLQPSSTSSSTSNLTCLIHIKLHRSQFGRVIKRFC
jgi:hypothetical protein